jgi:8-oxo-dGTP diphosphatase
VKTVTAGILIKNDKVLVGKRAPKSDQAGLWEFPGGKVEVGETPKACLRRELQEELAITVEVEELFGRSFFNYQAGSIELLAYSVRWVAGELKVLAHEEVRFVSADELQQLELAPADLPIAVKLSQYMRES